MPTRGPSSLRRALPWALAAAVLAGLLLALRPDPVEVEVATVLRGPLRVTEDGTGRTRVRERYEVAAPVAGHLERIALREGDPVRAGDVVARLQAVRPTPLDARTRAELAARVEAARAAQGEAAAAAERARLAAEQAGRDLSRARELAAGGSMSAADVEAAELTRRARNEEATMAAAGVRRAAGDAEAARAALAGASARTGERVPLRAPAAGRVLRVLRESEGPVAAGTPILQLGDPALLEAEIDLLTVQAVRVRPGARVDLVGWGGDGALAGRLRSVDPAAFTKVSALGVEEQRVHAVVVPDGPGWERLGDGWSVEGRIVVSERPDALKVRASALFRQGDRWESFAVEDGRARLRQVEVAESNGADVAIAAGLGEGARVVVHPPDRLADGVRVKVR